MSIFEDDEFISPNESILKCLISMNFQYTAIQLSSGYIENLDYMILNTK